MEDIGTSQTHSYFFLPIRQRAEYEDAEFEVEFEFTTLASAILYAVKEVKRGFYSFDMTLDGNPLTYHEIIEAFAPPR